LEFVFNASRLDYRMHNKLFIADGAAGLVGGRNVGDEYFQIDPQAQVADDDVFIAGPVVQVLAKSFDEFWNSSLAIPVSALHGGRPHAHELERHRRHLNAHWSRAVAADAEYLRRAQSGVPLEGILTGSLPLAWAQAQVVGDSPEKKQVVGGQKHGRLLYGPIAETLSKVRRQFTMITPYLVPTPEEMALLKSLRDRGVRVRILTNSLNSTNEITAHSGYVHYRRQLLDLGVELFEARAQLGPQSRGSGQTRVISSYGNYGLHAKLLVFDEDALYAGSMNFDQRSRRLNTEVGVIITSPVLAQQTLQRFAHMTHPSSAYALGEDVRPDGHRVIVWRTLEKDEPVEYSREPSRSPWRRLEAAMLSMLPLDAEL
jgi:putative cardiolipin synthase